jgi:putative iron-dependent peroxidase
LFPPSRRWRVAGRVIDKTVAAAKAGQLHAGLAGVMFVGFCRDITVTMGMLRHGVGYDGVSTTDRLLDFSTPLSSAIYFVPSIDALLAVGISPADPG